MGDGPVPHAHDLELLCVYLLVTPLTMLKTNEWVRPCKARFWRWSSGRSTVKVDSSCRTVIAPGSERDRVPWGPVTVTSLSSTFTLTPLGTSMGALPTRDISSLLYQT